MREGGGSESPRLAAVMTPAGGSGGAVVQAEGCGECMALIKQALVVHC